MASMRIVGNEYSLREAAGAFGDLGTLIPFIVGYITVAKIDPSGVLVAFGVFKIVAGLTYRTPVPIQPMKAIGTAAISSAGAITPAAIWASGLFTGVLWLVMGLSGAVSWIAKITSRPVIHGLVLGLGLGFLLEGIKLAQDELVLTVAAVVVTFVLLSYERVPAMLVLLGFGIVVSLVRDPALLAEFGGMSFRFRVPEVALSEIGWQDLVTGVLVLGQPLKDRPVRHGLHSRHRLVEHGRRLCRRSRAVVWVPAAVAPVVRPLLRGPTKDDGKSKDAFGER